MKPVISYCGQLVRENDPDRFLLTLFAPPERREGVWALFAFNYEIAKTREVVSDTQLGLIRLQWWREQIAKLYETGAAPEHEILKSLNDAIKAYNLPKGPFETLIYAREFDLENVSPSTLDGYFNYVDFTNTPLLTLALMICGDDPDIDPVSAVATNYALAGTFRSVKYFSLQRRCLLPEDLMKKHGVTLTQLYDFQKPEAGLKLAVREMAGYFVKGIRPQSKFLKAVQILAEIYMRQVRSLHYDVFSYKMIISPAFKVLRLVLWTF